MAALFYHFFSQASKILSGGHFLHFFAVFKGTAFGGPSAFYQPGPSEFVHLSIRNHPPQPWRRGQRPLWPAFIINSISFTWLPLTRRKRIIFYFYDAQITSNLLYKTSWILSKSDNSICFTATQFQTPPAGKPVYSLYEFFDYENETHAGRILCALRLCGARGPCRGPTCRPRRSVPDNSCRGDGTSITQRACAQYYTRYCR